MKRTPSIASIITALAALAACGHPGSAPATPTPTESTTPPTDPSAATADPNPADSTASATADATVGPIAATATATATVKPTPPAVWPPTTPQAEGCRFTVVAGTTGPAGISALGLGDGGGGYDMPDICPQQACSAGLTVDLPKDGDWDPGVYNVEIATDAAILSCHVTLKTPAAFHAPARCAHERELSFECAGPMEPNFGPVMISGTPSTVRIAIARDGTVLADQTLQPSYSSKRWDGWDCDPSCASAKGDVQVK